MLYFGFQCLETKYGHVTTVITNMYIFNHFKAYFFHKAAEKENKCNFNNANNFQGV